MENLNINEKKYCFQTEFPKGIYCIKNPDYFIMKDVQK